MVRHLEFFPNPHALLRTYSSKDPKLILAVPASLSHGPSRHLFCDFAAVPGNVVLLTGRGEDRTLGRYLFNRWNNSQRADDKWDKGKIGSNIMMDGTLRLRVSRFSPVMQLANASLGQQESPSRRGRIGSSFAKGAGGEGKRGRPPCNPGTESENARS